jgi:GT2 family glycosyltransferase
MGQCHSSHWQKEVIMNRPIVSIITVNYHQRDVTASLLRSIKLTGFEYLEVILVDNEANGRDSSFYNDIFPGIIYLHDLQNLGFAGANNRGIDAANGDYLFFVNNDTELGPGLISHLLRGFDSTKVGAVSPVIRYAEDPDQIQFAGYTEIHPLTGRNKAVKTLQGSAWIDSPYFHGAAVMIPRWVIDRVGKMPEEYFLYYEELDWSALIRKAGFQIRVAQQVSILHKESISTGKNSPLKCYYQTRNRIKFMQRHSDHFLLFLGFFLLVSLPKNLVSLKSSHRKAFLMACNDALIRRKFGWKNPQAFIG